MKVTLNVHPGPIELDPEHYDHIANRDFLRHWWRENECRPCIGLYATHDGLYLHWNAVPGFFFKPPQYLTKVKDEDINRFGMSLRPLTQEWSPSKTHENGLRILVATKTHVNVVFNILGGRMLYVMNQNGKLNWISVYSPLNHKLLRKD